MKRIIYAILIAMSLSATFASAASISPLEEVRFCGEPRRNADGTIYRSKAVTSIFKARYHCPSTGKGQGPCPGWQIDHVIPLACGGCDSISNMQWLPTDLKVTAKVGKDRFERVIYQTSILCNPSAK